MRMPALVKRVLIVGLLFLSPCVTELVAPLASYADDAVVLPKGYGRLLFDGNFYIPHENRYNDKGDTEAFGAPFSRPLNSQVFTALAPLNPFVGGLASFGNSNVSIKRDVQEFVFQPAYGLTDRLSIGAIVRYNRVTANVDAQLDTTTANVGFSTIPSPFGPAGSVVPIALVPGTRRATVGDVNNLLGAQFGLKPVETWQGEGFGDTDLGARYQYYRADNFRAAFTGGVRLPTGRMDDPDNLVDVGWSNGAYAMLFRFNQDWIYQKEGIGKRLGFPEPWSGFVNTTFSYDLNLPSKETLRICSPTFPLCTQKENVNRHVGDLAIAEISGKLGIFFEGLIFSPTYQYAYKFKDHNTGSNGLNYGALATDTQQSSHAYMLSLIYTTIPMVVQKHFSYPLSLSVNYRDRFAGENLPKSQYVGFTVQAYF